MKQAVQTPRDPHPEGQRKIIAYDLAINYCALRGEAETFQITLHPQLIEMPTRERRCCA